jgi:hypothetical protein
MAYDVDCPLGQVQGDHKVDWHSREYYLDCDKMTSSVHERSLPSFKLIDIFVFGLYGNL